MLTMLYETTTKTVHKEGGNQQRKKTQDNE